METRSNRTRRAFTLVGLLVAFVWFIAEFVTNAAGLDADEYRTASESLVAMLGANISFAPYVAFGMSAIGLCGCAATSGFFAASIKEPAKAKYALVIGSAVCGVMHLLLLVLPILPLSVVSLAVLFGSLKFWLFIVKEAMLHGIGHLLKHTN